MLVHRGEQWLLSVRGPGVDWSPGSVGLIGGHLEPTDAGGGALEATARRELREETGLDLTGTELHYLESTLFPDGTGLQLTVTFVAAAPEDATPVVGQPAELSEVGWWTAAEIAADPRTPEWLPALVERAARVS